MTRHGSRPVGFRNKENRLLIGYLLLWHPEWFRCEGFVDGLLDHGVEVYPNNPMAVHLPIGRYRWPHLFSISGSAHKECNQKQRPLLPIEKAPENYPRGHSVSRVFPAG